MIVVIIYNSIIAIVRDCYGRGDDVPLTVDFAIVQYNSFCGVRRDSVRRGPIVCRRRCSREGKNKVNAFQLVNAKYLLVFEFVALLRSTRSELISAARADEGPK